MDTNDLTEKAYEILRIAESINHLITIQLGALCGQFNDEDKYLKGVLKLLAAIKIDTKEFIEDWDIAEEIDGQTLYTGLVKLEKYTTEVLKTPIEKRGVTIEDKYYG